MIWIKFLCLPPLREHSGGYSEDNVLPKSADLSLECPHQGVILTLAARSPNLSLFRHGLGPSQLSSSISRRSRAIFDNSGLTCYRDDRMAKWLEHEFIQVGILYLLIFAHPYVHVFWYCNHWHGITTRARMTHFLYSLFSVLSVNIFD